FRFRAGGAPPAAKPMPPPPKAAPVAAPPAPPRSVPVTRPAEPAVFVPPPEPRRPRRAAKAAGRGRGRRWLPVALVLGLLALAAGAAGWVYRDAWLGGAGPSEEDAPAVQSLPMNYRFRPPRAPWTEDRGVLRESGASFAMRRTDPNAWFAVLVKDYKDRNPRDDELEHEAVTRLKKLFKKGVEYEHRDEDAFAGQPAQRFVGTAENSSNVAQSGECLMTAYNGIAY